MAVVAPPEHLPAEKSIDRAQIVPRDWKLEPPDETGTGNDLRHLGSGPNAPALRNDQLCGFVTNRSVISNSCRRHVQAANPAAVRFKLANLLRAEQS